MKSVLVLEPWNGGSHRIFWQGLSENSKHRFHIVGHSANRWKWRMRASAVEMAKRVAFEGYDLIMCSDYLDLATFLGLADPRFRQIPSILMMHENQITYPARFESERDNHYKITNLTSAMAAGRVLFNSEWHRGDFFDGARDLVRVFPDFRSSFSVAEIEAKSSVVPLGIDTGVEFPDPIRRPRTILWNHRWEHDKNPELLLRTMLKLQEHHKEFELVLAGQRFDRYPQVFDELAKLLGPKLKGFGNLSREDYRARLADSQIVLSTADHEFFGLSIMEATAAGCLPIVPNRLSYPELIPQQYHDLCLYADQTDLVAKLCEAIARSTNAPRGLIEHARTFDWQSVIELYDEALS